MSDPEFTREEWTSEARSIGRSWTVWENGRSVTRSVSFSFAGDNAHVSVRREDGGWESPISVSVDEIQINESGEPTWQGKVVRIVSPDDESDKKAD